MVSAERFVKFGQLSGIDTDSIVKYAEADVRADQFNGNPDLTVVRLGFDAMRDSVFDQRLQDQRNDQCLVQAIIYLPGNRNRIFITIALDIDIFFAVFQFGGKHDKMLAVLREYRIMSARSSNIRLALVWTPLLKVRIS